jgi:AcrR family transcriptional regulator
VRGPYAKSKIRRADIIERATEAFSTNGFHGSSQREIAAAVGLTQPGLVHHFGTKEELLEAVLEHKDEVQTEAFDNEHVLDGLRDLVEQNLAQPGLIRLHTTLSAESINPTHPGHAYFGARYHKARGLFSGLLRRAQQDGQIAGDADPEALAVLIVAVMDGLQLQWLHDEDVDVRSAFDSLLSLLAPR